MNKKLYVFLALILCMNFSFSQVVTIGIGDEKDDIPLDLYFNYNYSQTLYLASEIGQSGTIHRIKYKGDSGISIANADNWVVYVGHTSLTTFTSNVWVPTSEMTQVFSGTVSVVNDNVEVELDTPFVYNGTDNLIIAIDENGAGYAGSNFDFLASDVTGMRSIIYRNDNTNPDPENMDGVSTISRSSVPNIDLDFNAVSCDGPSDLAVANVLATSADLSWTAGGSESSWHVEYGSAGFTLGTGTEATVSSASHNVSGLNPASDYEFYVQADCGAATSAWVGPFVFNTACATVTALPFIEDFESITSGQPNCWGIAGTTTSATYHWNSTSNGYEGRGMRFNSAFNSNGNTSELTTPILDITSLTNAQLRFYFQNESGGAFEVSVSNDGGATYTILESELTGYADWTLKTYDLTPYKDSDVVVQFKGTSNYDFSSYIYLDSVLIQETPSCEAPSNLLVSNLNATSAQLNWTVGASETAWEVEYGTSGFTQGNGTTVVAATNPFEVSTLTPETAYEFYVRANCGGEFSTWTGPFEFTTPCEAYTIPFVEGFETGYTDGDNVEGCLSQENISGTYEWTANNSATSYNRTPRTGDWNAYLRYSNQDWLFIPITLVSGQSYTVDVYARQDGSNASNASVSISYGTEATAAAMTNQILAPQGLVNGDYQKLSGNFVPASDGVFYIGLNGNINGSPWYISIDDIRIDLTPNCVSPNNLSATNITDTTATLGWEAQGSELLWDIEYGIDGFSQGAGTVVNDVNTNSYNVSGLMTTTDYDFYVRANCGSEYSEWFGPFNFTTICGAFSAPYTQNFDAVSTPNLDACWSADIVGATSSFASIETTTFNEVSSPNSVRLNNSGDTDGVYYLISPRFSDLDHTKRVRFQMYKNIGDDAEGDVIEVGILTDASDYGTYEAIYTFAASDFDEDAWKQMAVDFGSYTGGAAHVVIKYTPGTGTYNSFYFDDFIYDVTPTVVPDCASNLQNVLNDTNCGNGGVQLSWDAAVNTDGYRLTIGTTSGGNEIIDNLNLGNVTSYELATTLVSTTYYWLVTPYNAVGDATGCAEATFATISDGCYCEPMSTNSSTYIDSFTTINAYTNVENTNSGYAADGYEDNFDSANITVNTSSFDFSLALVGGSAGCAIWVDWNKDFVFDEATELVYETTSYTNGPIDATIALPNDTPNDVYRMRIIVDFSDASPGDNACAFNNTRGEAEDYKLTVDNTLSVTNNTLETFKYYPNPVEDVLHISAQDNLTNISVYNLVGQEVIFKAISQRVYQLDMSELTSGVYMVKISNDTVSKTFKVLKQ